MYFRRAPDTARVIQKYNASMSTVTAAGPFTVAAVSASGPAARTGERSATMMAAAVGSTMPNVPKMARNLKRAAGEGAAAEENAALPTWRRTARERDGRGGVCRR